MPTYYTKYKNVEDKVEAMIGLIHKGVVRVLVTGKRNMNMSKSVTMEHCYKDEGKQEKKRKMPRWLSCTFKERRRNYLKGKIYIKQQLLKNSFEVKR